MNIKSIKDVTTHSRSIDIEGGPRLPAGHPRGDYEIEAWRITIDWTSDTQPRMIHINGPRILKSGELGKWCGVSYVIGETRPDAIWPAPPKWVLDVIA